LIPQETVQEIIETAKIEDVVSEFVNLKRRGVNMIGLCPFHNEKTPSFTVSPTKNIFKCFGCGQGGDPVKFLMEHESFTYPEALRYLAKKYGIEIEEKELTPEEQKQQQEKDSLFIINQFALEFYQKQLFETDQGKSIGLNYFKERGFNQETIRKFGLGFAPNANDRFTLTAVQQGYNIDLLRKLGLTTKYDRDFFRNRVLFTIHNLSGKPIAFAGRILQKDVKAPKYINSPETDIYTKNKVLYGAYFAKQPIRKEDECILVEGYTDVISLHQAGIENVVASSGTSLTEGQIRLVKRYSENIKILYDGDAAGVKAALRGLDLVLEQDMNVKVVLLPEGEDPDSYLQTVGRQAFKEYIEKEAKDFIFFKTNLLLDEAAGDPIQKTMVIKDIVGSIAKIPDPLKRSLYIKECANRVDVEEYVLVNEVQQVLKKDFKKNRLKRNLPPTEKKSQLQPVREEDKPREQQSNKTTTHEFQEKDIARILVAAGDQIFDEDENITIAEFIIGEIEDVLDEFDGAMYGKIAKICYQRLVAEQSVYPKFFFQHEDAEISKTAIDLTTTPYEYSDGWDKREIVLQSQKMPELNFEEDSIQALQRFKLKKIEKMGAQNQQKIKLAQEAKNYEEVITLLKIQNQINDIRNSTAKQLRTVILK